MKLCLGPLGGDVVAELPFVLMHPKPEDNNVCSKPLDPNNPDGEANESEANKEGNAEANLIQLDT